METCCCKAAHAVQYSYSPCQSFTFYYNSTIFVPTRISVKEFRVELNYCHKKNRGDAKGKSIALFGWEIQPATTVFSSHAKSASQPTSSVFLSRQISQPSSQPASRTRRLCVSTPFSSPVQSGQIVKILIVTEDWWIVLCSCLNRWSVYLEWHQLPVSQNEKLPPAERSETERLFRQAINTICTTELTGQPDWDRARSDSTAVTGSLSIGCDEKVLRTGRSGTKSRRVIIPGCWACRTISDGLDLNGWTNNAAGSLIDRSVELANQQLAWLTAVLHAMHAKILINLEWRTTQVHHKYTFRSVDNLSVIKT